MDIDLLISQLSLLEKAKLVAGYKFMLTYPVKRLNIPSIVTSDGPNGLRKQSNKKDNGVNVSEIATCFPSSTNLASSWNIDLAYLEGQAIAKECKYYNVNILLAPGVNIKRNPLNGRNFEYYSEDPYISYKIASHFINGVQGENVGACIKHYAGNNNEDLRFVGNSIIDKRSLNEIYLKAFEKVIKEVKPACIMSAYNKLNNVFCSENKELLTTILKDKWNYDGLVMTDWGGMHNKINSLKAGLDLEMPGDNKYNVKQIIDAINSNQLDIKDLDRAVRNVLKLIDKYSKVSKLNSLDFEKHSQLARKIAEDSIVLLKNEKDILPLNTNRKYLVVGDLFSKMRYQGAGSSMINPYKIVSPKDGFDKLKIDYEFELGYKENQIEVDEYILNSAINKAKEYETIVVFIGLTDYFESEGGNRRDLKLPVNQLKLMEELIKLNKKIIVCLFGGSVVELPFLDKIQALINMHLPGQEGGLACSNVLFGKVNPSGRLTETWIKKYEDVPFYKEYNSSFNEVYKESIFVGYRYYLTCQKEVNFPFGYGLSYTKFEYSNLEIKKDNKIIKISLNVKNTGNRYGGEVIQIYVSNLIPNFVKPYRELKGFDKVYLKPDETKRVEINIDINDLSYFNIKQDRWILLEGKYLIQACKNANETVLSQEIFISGEKYNCPYSKEINDIYLNLEFDKVDNRIFEKMSNLTIPKLESKLPLTIESQFKDLQLTKIGKLIYKILMMYVNIDLKRASKLKPGPKKDNRIKGALFLKRIFNSNSFICMSNSSAKQLTYNIANGIVLLANGHVFKGIKSIFTRIKLPKEK